MVENAPPPIDLQEFQFKLHSKLKIFENTDDSKFRNSYNLVAAASRYGLVFVGSPNSTLEVIPLKSIEGCSLTKVENPNFPRRSVPLPAAPSHIAVNCDQKLLSVICLKNDCPTAIVYNVHSFFSQNPVVVREIRLSATPGIQVCEAGWNPAIPGCLTACKADGSLGVYNLNENSVDIHELPVAAAARSFCWSPKGKQLVVGSTNGLLTQYKPDLKAVKVIPAPTLENSGMLAVLSVFWVSNYQFVAIYKNNDDSRPSIVVVNAPKTGPTTYINYDDICYSNGALRGPQYYIIHQPTWGVMLFASANSMELGVLGLPSPSEPSLWVQWNQPDSARAELPLSAARSETFPVGLAFDTGVQLQLPWGENQQLPPMPFVYILSHHGVLCTFSVINVKPGVPTVCHPPEMVAITPGAFQEPKRTVLEMVSSVAQTVTTTMQQIGVQTMQTFNHHQPTFTLQAKQPTPHAFITSNAPTFGSPSPAAFGSLAAKQPALGAAAAVVVPLDAGAGGRLGPPHVGAAVPPPAAPGPAAAPPLLAPAPPHPQLGGHAPALSSAPSCSAGVGYNPPAGAVPHAAGVLPPPATTRAPDSSLFAGTPPGVHTQHAPTAASSSVSNLFGGVSSHSTAHPSGGPTGTGGCGGGDVGSKHAAMFNLAPANVTITPVSKPLLSTPKPQPKPDIINQTPISETPKKDDTIINDQIVQSMIKEEVKNFQSELKVLFTRCKNISLDVGTDEEKTNLVLTTESLLEFYKELQDTTDSQLAEVHYLKQALMQSFAWYEDTKARHRRYTDPNFSSLLQAQELDPISEKQMADIKHLIYYIEAQLKEVDGFLDNQWADFQDSCKKQVKGKLQIPTLEPIYQSMVRQSAVLEKQKYVLKDIAARIKMRNKKAASYPHVMNVSLANTRNTEIDEELRKLKIDTGDPFSTRYDKVVAQHNKFSENKQSKLCSFFTNRNVVHISPKKPKFINSLFSNMNTPPVQRNLTQAFNKMDVSFNNSPAEANLSASNVFSFSLLDGASSTKVNTPPKPVTTLFNTPKSAAQAAPTAQPAAAASKPSNLFNLSSTTSSSGVFNFTAVSTATTQSKPVNFGSGDMSPQLMFTGGTTKFTTQPVKPSESKKPADVVVIKPSVQKSTAEPSFNFNASQAKISAHPKPVANLFGDATAKNANIFGDPTTTVGGRDSIGPGFNFGSALSLGQQSTPKPKSPEGLSIAQILSSPTTAASAKPIVTTVQIAVPKPVFGLAATTTAGNSPQAASTAVQVKPEPAFIAATTSNIFGGLSLGKITSSGPLFGENSISTSAATGNIFGSVAAVPTAMPGSLFGAKAAAQPEKSVASVTTVPSSPTGSTGFSFSLAAASTESAKSTTSIFGGSAATSEAPKSAASVTTAATSPTGSTEFSFTQAAVSSEPAKSTSSMFGGSAATNEGPKPAASVFAGAAATTNIFGGAPAISTSIVTKPVGNLFGTLAATTEAAKPVTITGSAAPTSEAAKPVPSEANKPPVNVFASTAQTSIFAAATSEAAKPAPSVFGGSAASTPTSPSVFPAASSAATGFSFLQPAASVASSATITPVQKPATVFAEQKPAEAAVTSTAAVSSAVAASGFGAPASTAQSSFGFGAAAPTSSNSNSNSSFSFGNLTVSALSPSSVATPAASAAPAASTNTAGFSFALPATTSTTTVTTTSASAFGGYSQSLFGKPAEATTSTSSFMGQTVCSPSSFSQPQGGSAFGQNSGNIFAQKPATPTASSGSIFGQTSGGNAFGQTSTAATSASSTSIFGQAQTNNPFGNPATTQSIFGQTSAFGTPSTTSSIFGQSSFGAPAATSASGSFSFTQNTGNFGQSGGSIFAAKPAFGAAPAFGQAPAFGAPPAFGGSPAAAGGNVFGSPQASNNPSSGFGSPAAFGSPAGFGQKPAFGSPPSFGQSAFGSPAAFGSPPGFNTSQRVFGGAASPTAGTFGGGVQENSTFANLATQSTIGFGNLVQNQPVQQQPQQPPPQFSGGAQFSSWR